jgi:hypothetical protein
MPKSTKAAPMLSSDCALSKYATGQREETFKMRKTGIIVVAAVLAAGIPTPN